MRCLLLIFIATIRLANAQNVLQLEGTYKGENLYVQNPFYGLDSCCCTDSVLINNKRIKVELSTAYEIPLKEMKLKMYEKIEVRIYHKPSCSPKMINYGHPTKAFIAFTSIDLDKTGKLKWTTNNDTSSVSVWFIVEQFRWNKWVKIGEVQQQSLKEYEFVFHVPLHSGENRCRVKYMEGISGKYRLSKNVSITSDVKPVTYKIDKQKKLIAFSGETLFELFDRGGNMLKKGSGTTIDVSSYDGELFYLCYDNKIEDVRW